MAGISTAERIARYGAKYLVEHPGADPHDPAVIRAINKGGRGHAHTAEHGSSVQVQAASRTIYVTNSAQEAKRLISAAASNGQRVSIGIMDEHNTDKVRTVWTNRRPGGETGISAKYLKSSIGAQNVKKYLEGTHFGGGGPSGHTSPGYFPTGISSIEVTVYH